MRESDTWPVRIEATFVDSYGTTDMGEFAEWLTQVDADPATVQWWVEMAQLQTDAFATVLVVAGTE
jgi:hypothetical protein